MEINRRAWGEMHSQFANSLNIYALAIQQLQRLPEAERIFERVLKIREMTLGPNHPGTARSLPRLSCLLESLTCVLGACGWMDGWLQTWRARSMHWPTCCHSRSAGWVTPRTCWTAPL